METRPGRPVVFLVVTWALNVCINAFYISPAPVFPEMIRDLGISKAFAGSLISFYLLSILLFQLPAGYVIDRVDPRRVIPTAGLALLGFSAAMSLLPTSGSLLVLRILAGIPVAFTFVPSAFMVSRAFQDRPGRAVGLFLSAPPAGVAAGNLLSPFVAAAFGWPTVFVAFTVPLLALVPLFIVVSRGLPEREHERFGLGEYLRAFRSQELWKIGLVFACSYAAYIFFSSWSPTFLREANGIDVTVVGVLSALIPAAGILSRPLGGHLAEGRFARDKRLVPISAFLLLGIAGLAVPFAGPAAAPILVAGGFLAQFPFSVYYLFSTQVMPPRFAGTAYAFMNTTSLIGGAIAPGLAGLLVDLTGSFLPAFGMIALTSALGFLLAVRIRER